MMLTDQRTDVLRVFVEHGVDANADEVDALISRALAIKSAGDRRGRDVERRELQRREKERRNREREKPPTQKRQPLVAPGGWNAEEREAALGHAGSLLAYLEAPPRGKDTAANRRVRLEKLIDRLSVFLLLLTSPRQQNGEPLGYDLNEFRDALRQGSESREQLTAFIAAVNALPVPGRTGRPPAPYLPIVRATSNIWQKQFGADSTATSISYPAETGIPTMTGPFAAFLRAVFVALEIRWPGDEPVHQQLRKLKKPET